MKTAPAPLSLIPGGPYSIDFAVALEIDKRLNHLPLDRPRRQMAREGLEISTQTMWDQEERSRGFSSPTTSSCSRTSWTTSWAPTRPTGG